MLDVHPNVFPKTPAGKFFLYLDGVLNRGEKILEDCTTREQIEAMEKVLTPLMYIKEHQTDILELLQLEKGTSFPVRTRESDSEYDLTVDVFKNKTPTSKRSPIYMFYRELDELHMRAVRAGTIYNDADQNKIYEGIVIHRLRFIKYLQVTTIKVITGD